MTATDRRRWAELHADRQTIERAATWLRTLAWEESYAGLRDKDRAFAIALFLEAVSFQLDRIPPGLRVEAVRVASWLLGERRM